MKQPLLIPIRHRGKECYQLVESYEFLHGLRKFTIPEGFVCDGASVPRLLWPWMPPDGLHRAAALAHDLVFASGHTIEGHTFTLWEADLMFRRLMIEGGVSKIRATITWGALKLGSWRPWARCVGSKPEIIPVRNAAPSSYPRKQTRFTRHLYARP